MTFLKATDDPIALAEPFLFLGLRASDSSALTFGTFCFWLGAVTCLWLSWAAVSGGQKREMDGTMRLGPWLVKPLPWTLPSSSRVAAWRACLCRNVLFIRTLTSKSGLTVPIASSSLTDICVIPISKCVHVLTFWKVIDQHFPQLHP